MNTATQLRKVVSKSEPDLISNDLLVARAQELAKVHGATWSDKLDEAQRQLEFELTKRRKAAKPRRAPIGDEELRKSAVVSQLRHQQPGIGNPDPDRRIEIGECETALGRVRVAISRDSISIHGVHAPIADLDADLRGAVITAAASFAAAATDLEQTEQRAVIGFLVDAILRRHQFLSASVKEVKHRERYDV